MPTLLRWTVRGMLGLLAFLLFETGVVGLPEAISSQAVLVKALGGEWIIRLVALALGTVVALAVAGPNRLRAWGNALSDWWHSDARRVERLREDNERLTTERDALKAKLETYEGGGASEVVVETEYKAPHGGPVLGNHPSDESGLIELKFSQLESNVDREKPAAIIEVDGPEDAHLIALRYEVRGGGQHQYEPEKTIRTATHLQVLDESGKVVMYPTIYTGMAAIAEDEYWRYTVSRSYAISGLARGVYKLRVFDYASGRGGRNYYDMRLVITKLAQSARSPVVEG